MTPQPLRSIKISGATASMAKNCKQIWREVRCVFFFYRRATSDVGLNTKKGHFGQIIPNIGIARAFPHSGCFDVSKFRIGLHKVKQFIQIFFVMEPKPFFGLMFGQSQYHLKPDLFVCCHERVGSMYSLDITPMGLNLIFQLLLGQVECAVWHQLLDWLDPCCGEKATIVKNAYSYHEVAI